MKEQIKQILLQHRGRANPITGRELACLLNQSDDRKIRMIIRVLIAEGLPVASATDSPAGYYIVSSYKEAEIYAAGERKRLIEIATRRRDFRRAADMSLKQLVQGRLI